MRRFNYGWGMVLVAAAAMVGTLPGRTQGLGLITEPLLKDLALDRVAYAQLNLGATLLGALFSIGLGSLQDRVGSRATLLGTALSLGGAVLAMGRVTETTLLFVSLVLVRGLGQSALSVVSVTLVGQWFREGLEKAMAVFTVLLTVGFMIAFPVVGAVIEKSGWRVAWSGIGWGLLLGLAPLALLVKKPLQDTPLAPAAGGGLELGAALRTPAFWVMGLASALYGLIASGIGLFNENILKELGFAASVYHTSLAVTALTGLLGNFFAGGLARRGALNRLMALAMLFLMLGLGALPLAHTLAIVMGISALFGVASGFVMVLFFSVWAYAFGQAHLGKIQGVAQLLTVVASAVGPLLLAEVYQKTGTYTTVFYLLAGLVGVVGIACWFTQVSRFTPAHAVSPPEPR